MATHKTALPRIDDQVFANEGGDAFGAVRVVEPNGRPELIVYVENAGEFAVSLESVSAVHDGKVVLKAASLPQALRDAIRHAHEREED
jgi:hypothetical protein